MTRKMWTWGGVLGPVAILAVLVWRLGAGPFLDGLRALDAPALAAAASLALLSTVCCAWRWKIVAGGLGVEVSLPGAVVAYYRSQFLNVTLPGGIIGDVHRGIRHGRQAGDVNRCLRAVAWERSAGQAVQAILTLAVLLALPSPVQASMPVVAVGLGAAGLALAALTRTRGGGGHSAWARVRNAVAGDLRGLLARRAWPRIALASAIVVASHAVTFLIAARCAGTSAQASEMVPIALLVMLAMVVPNVAGWGPREGVTAWAFGAAGLGAQRGVTTAVVYGVMVLVASLPGAVVLVVAWLRGPHRRMRNRGAVAEAAAHG